MGLRFFPPNFSCWKKNNWKTARVIIHPSIYHWGRTDAGVYAKWKHVRHLPRTDWCLFGLFLFEDDDRQHLTAFHYKDGVGHQNAYILQIRCLLIYSSTKTLSWTSHEISFFLCESKAWIRVACLQYFRDGFLLANSMNVFAISVHQVRLEFALIPVTCSLFFVF